MPSLDFFNYYVGLGTFALQFVALALLIALLFRRRYSVFNDVVEFVGNWGLWAGFLLTLGATVMSLFYSEVLGLIPCGLCWLIRIFMFSQVVLFAVALWKRDRSIADYSIALSVIGFVIALYNHYIQMGGAEFIACPASGNVDCARRFLFEFGYITFPFTGVVLFATVIVIMFIIRRK